MYHLWQRSVLTSVILFLFANGLSAQMDYYNQLFTHTKDSLVKELSKHPQPDTARAHALMDILNCALFSGQKKQVIPYWEQALLLSRKLKNKTSEAECLEWRGTYYKSIQKTDSALIYLDAAIDMAGNPADRGLRTVKRFALFERGMLYEFQENFYSALNSYFEALKMYEGSDFQRQKMISLRIASIYEKLHNDEKALEYYQLALKMYESGHDQAPAHEAEGIYGFIAGIYYNRGDLAKASFYLDKLKPSMPNHAETMITGGYYHLAGQIALKQNKTDTAAGLLKNALTYFNYTRQMHMDEIADVSADLASLDMGRKQMKEAKKYADQSMAFAKQSGHKETRAKALEVAAAYYSKSGNPSRAYRALQEAAILNDSVLAEANIKQAATLAAIYENGKKEKEIAQLITDRQIQSASVKQKALLNTIFIITIAALVLFGSTLYANFKNRQKIERQKIAELEKEKQLMGVEAMLKGQEEERTRLAKDLHDGLGGMLSGIKISFSNMKENLILDAANAHAFEKSLLQLDQTISELRKVAHNLMPEALVKFGLTSAVRDFCKSMQLSGSTTIICEIFGPERELGNIADVNVYRIVQELVNNAVVHGKASQVIVQLTKAAGKLLITVEDNGAGFDLHAPGKSGGMGLQNVKFRVNYLHGRMDIDSKPGEGAVINIELIV